MAKRTEQNREPGTGPQAPPGLGVPVDLSVLLEMNTNIARLMQGQSDMSTRVSEIAAAQRDQQAFMEEFARDTHQLNEQQAEKLGALVGTVSQVVQRQDALEERLNNLSQPNAGGSSEGRMKAWGEFFTLAKTWGPYVFGGLLAGWVALKEWLKK